VTVPHSGEHRLAAPALPEWLAKLVPFERYVLRVGDHRIHVMETGTGTPVVMLHGNPTWGFLWRRVAESLSGEPYRLIMPDLLGLGYSDKPPASWHSIERHAEVIGKVIDAIVPGKLVFVGQDWGGPIGLRALADRRDRLTGLVLLNTVASPPREDFSPSMFHRFARLPLVSSFCFRVLGFPQIALHIAQGDRASIRGEVARAYREPLRRMRDNAAPLALARMVPSDFSHPSIAPLKRCQELVESYKGPAAIVWGDRDPVLGSVRGWIEKLLPQAKVTRTQAGHFLQEEVPREIADAIRFVTRAAAPQ
jgi:haloalkane dehalogenase